MTCLPQAGAEGVVVDTELLWDKSQELMLEKRGLSYDREYLKPKMAGQTLQEGTQLIKDYYGLNESVLDIADERRVLIHALFETEIEYIEGFLPFVNTLKNANKFSISIATAMSKDLMQKVERKLNLEQIFNNHIYFIQDVGNKSKPAPDVFLLAAEKMDVSPINCVVIEDAPHGIEAANCAGMISVGLTTTFSSFHLSEANFIVGDFTEVSSLLNLAVDIDIDN